MDGLGAALGALAGGQAPHAVGIAALADTDAVVPREIGGRERRAMPAQVVGAAHSSRRLGATFLAMMRASGGSPKRMQTSKASSFSGGGSAVSCSCTSTPGTAGRTRDGRCDMPAPEAERGIDAQQLARPALGLCQQLIEIVDLAQDAPRVLQEHLAFRRQAHAPRGARDQRHADARLHLRQALADRGRGDAEIARRRAQAARRRQRDEKPSSAGWVPEGVMVPLLIGG